MSVDRDSVHHYAALANLTFTDGEAKLLAQQLGQVLKHVAKINELDLGETVPTRNVNQHHTPVRDDLPRDGLGCSQALTNAPDQESGYFLVPKVIQK